MSELDSLLIKYNVSGYIHGHAHYMAHSIKKSTIYLLAGASGQDLQAQKCHDDDGCSQRSTTS